MKIDWTDDRYATVKRMWEEGYRREEIAAAISPYCTPNAISGVVHRRGYERKVTASERKANQEETPPPLDQPKVLPHKSQTKKTPETKKGRQMETEDRIDDFAEREQAGVRRVTKSPFKGIDDVVSAAALPWPLRKLKECAYPVGPEPSRPALQEACCNRVQPGKSYCRGHMQIMFPDQKRRN